MSKDAGTIQVEQVYTQSPAQVWRALTDPALVARWWAPGEIRAEVGHRFDMDMGPWGKQPCEVLTVEPETLFRYRFAESTLDTIITWQLEPEGTGTKLRLTHSGFDVESAAGKSAYEGMKPGWPGVLQKLRESLA